MRVQILHDVLILEFSCLQNFLILDKIAFVLFNLKPIS